MSSTRKRFRGKRGGFAPGPRTALLAILLTGLGVGLVLTLGLRASSGKDSGRAEPRGTQTGPPLQTKLPYSFPPAESALPGTDELLATAARLSREASPPPLRSTVRVDPRKRDGEPLPPAGKTLVFVIDDAGYSLSELEPFLALAFPLTIAVLPRLPESAESARRILEAGKELILHQPMEAIGGSDPGPGAVMLSTGPKEAERIVSENLDSVPGALGLNNHMGSAVTRNEGLMRAILELAKRRGIYYLDSLTAPDTATAGVAFRENMRYWERSVFLDNSPDRASILRSVDEGKKKAEIGRPAVMIGHIWSSELAATLTELYPLLAEEGFSLSTISRLMIEEANARSRH